jgi:catechol 2,3-dioxygenase-like lactoylglutathione lyase family enzyme
MGGPDSETSRRAGLSLRPTEDSMKIGLVEVFVDDQERACAFYTEVLGLQVKDDAPYDEGARWLTVFSPEDLDGTELLLAPISNETAALQAARREIRKPTLTLRTRDCRQTIANS